MSGPLPGSYSGSSFENLSCATMNIVAASGVPTPLVAVQSLQNTGNTFSFRRYLGQQQTTMLAGIVLCLHPIAVGCSALIHAYIVGVCTGGSSGTVGETQAFDYRILWRNTAGTLEAIGSEQIQAWPDAADWRATSGKSGSNVYCSAIGADNTNITWTAVMDVVENNK